MKVFREEVRMKSCYRMGQTFCLGESWVETVRLSVIGIRHLAMAPVVLLGRESGTGYAK